MSINVDPAIEALLAATEVQLEFAPLRPPSFDARGARRAQVTLEAGENLVQLVLQPGQTRRDALAQRDGVSRDIPERAGVLGQLHGSWRSMSPPGRLEDRPIGITGEHAHQNVALAVGHWRSSVC